MAIRDRYAHTIADHPMVKSVQMSLSLIALGLRVSIALILLTAQE